eukprot:4272345-Pyramimonas_sp.AAC.1
MPELLAPGAVFRLARSASTEPTRVHTYSYVHPERGSRRGLSRRTKTTRFVSTLSGRTGGRRT